MELWKQELTGGTAQQFLQMDRRADTDRNAAAVPSSANWPVACLECLSHNGIRRSASVGPGVFGPVLALASGSVRERHPTAGHGFCGGPDRLLIDVPVVLLVAVESEQRLHRRSWEH